MNDNEKTCCVGLGLLKSAGDFLLAAGLVVAICWGLLQAAQVMENRPIRPNADGNVVLPAWKATLQGSVAKYPDDLERQATDFAYHYGRDLHAERLNRKIGRWHSTDAHVEWSFQIDEPGTYAIELEYSCPADEAGSDFVLEVAGQQFAGRVAATGGADVWKTSEVGRVKVSSAGVYRLRIRARTIAHENVMNLKQVALSIRYVAPQSTQNGT